MTLEHINQELQTLKEKKNYRSLPPLIHEGRDVLLNGQRMLNLSSNDYLGLSNDISLRKEFLKTLTPETFLPTSSSSRLLTGNFSDYQKLEQQLATMFGTESALIFNSGYHANTGILPAICNTHTLILADKLVHASLIDGIKLSSAKCIRYRHNDISQLQRLIAENHNAYEQLIIVTESIFENRFKYADELSRMGANIKVEGNSAIIDGVRKLTGARVSAPDLRAGAALVIAGMAADGITIVDDIVYIQRGYERFEEKLRSLGAVIERVSTEREIQKFKLKVG